MRNVQRKKNRNRHDKFVNEDMTTIYMTYVTFKNQFTEQRMYYRNIRMCVYVHCFLTGLQQSQARQIQLNLKNGYLRRQRSTISIYHLPSATVRIILNKYIMQIVLNDTEKRIRIEAWSIYKGVAVSIF